jgi:hypothetical protein
MIVSGMTDVKAKALSSVLHKLRQTLSDGHNLRPVAAAELQLSAETLARFTRYFVGT